MKKDNNNLSGQLGQTVPLPESPDVAVLDAVQIRIRIRNI